MTTTYAGSC